MDPENGDGRPSAYEIPDPGRAASATPTERLLEEQVPGGTLSAGHDPYAALRLPGFRVYLGGWVLSVVGQQILSTAVNWEIYQRAKAGGTLDANLAVGLIGAALAGPVILLALPAGHLADRFDRRRILIGSQALSAACSLTLAAVSHKAGPLWLIYLLLVLSAVANALGWPARTALLPQVVPAKYFSNATTWSSSFFQIAATTGPALGGILLVRGPSLAYVADAACALAFLSFLAVLRVQAAPRAREPASLENLLAGIRFVFREKIVLATITLDLFAVLLGGATALLPAYAGILGVGEVGFGWLRAAPAIGAFVMAIAQAHLPPMRRAGSAMLWAVVGFGIATIIFALSRSFVLSLLMLMLTGAFDNVSVVVRHTLVQMLTPDSMRGRVSAVNNVFIGASNELGSLESGLTAWFMGPVASVVAGGFGAVLAVAAVAVAWPQIRRFGALSDAQPQKA